MSSSGGSGTLRDTPLSDTPVPRIRSAHARPPGVEVTAGLIPVTLGRMPATVGG
jgi:hypothetical protein